MIDTSLNSNAAIILKTAKDLFWKHGLRKVSVEEISKKAGVSKMTFYRNFKNKKEVAKVVLEELMKQSNNDYQRIMKDERFNFSEKMAQLIELKQQSVKNMSKDFLTDLYHPSFVELVQEMEKHRTKSLRLIKKDFRKAQKDGFIRKDLKIDFIMYMFNDIGQKAQDEHLLKMYKNSSELIMALTNFCIYGISENKK
ncbi:MAG: TetR/AcrR family transcriptional regulator [Saprospiraceae bacterium]